MAELLNCYWVLKENRNSVVFSLLVNCHLCVCARSVVFYFSAISWRNKRGFLFIMPGEVMIRFRNLGVKLKAKIIGNPLTASKFKVFQHSRFNYRTCTNVWIHGGSIHISTMWRRVAVVYLRTQLTEMRSVKEQSYVYSRTVCYYILDGRDFRCLLCAVVAVCLHVHWWADRPPCAV